MLKTFSRWCTALLFGLGLSTTAYADNWNPPPYHSDQGFYHDGGLYRDGGFHDGAYFGDGCCDPCHDECCWRNGCFGIQVDALSWTARQDNLGFGVKVFTVASSEGSVNEFVKVLRPSFDWDAGFRVGLHYLQPDNWDIGLIYTRFNTDSKKTRTSNPGTNATEDIFVHNQDIGLFFGEFFDDVFQRAHSSWELDVNYVDLDFSRTCCCGPCLKFRPHFGARAFWMEQHFRIHGETFAGIAGAITNDVLRARLREHFWGYGLEGGIWGEMALGCGASLIGHFGGSLLYSKFDIREFGNEEIFAGTAVGEVLNREVRDHIRTGTPSLDFFLGLQYGGCCCGSEYTLRVGWEQHVFFRMNRFSHCNGDLTLQGITFSGQVDF